MPQSAEKSLEEAVALQKAASEESAGGATKVIDFPHAEVHEGCMWHASYMTEEGAEIADNATLIFLIRTGAAAFPHLVFEISAGGNTEIDFLEGPDITGDGNNVPTWNMRRPSVAVPEVGVWQGPTVGGNGDRMVHNLLAGGTKNFACGGVVRPGTEWILAKSTEYLLILTNRSGAAQPMSVSFQWYDHNL